MSNPPGGRAGVGSLSKPGGCSRPHWQLGLRAPINGRHKAPSSGTRRPFTGNGWPRDGSDHGTSLILAGVFRGVVVIYAPVFDANHRVLSRLPSRRQPFRSESRDQCEKSVETSIKFSRRLRVEIHRGFRRTDHAGAGRQHAGSGGVSDHAPAAGLAGQAAISSGRSRHGIAVGDRSAVAPPGGRHSAPPEDDGLQPAR